MIVDAAPVALDEALWGAAPTETEVADARRSAQRESEARLGEARAASVTVEEAAGRAGLSVDAVAAAVAAGQLLTVPAADGKRLIPTWQLAAARGTAGVDGPALGRVAELARAFPGSTVALTLWARRPSPDLAGRTPAQALADGDAGAVIATAQGLRSAGW
jgi:hypothetical protein